MSDKNIEKEFYVNHAGMLEFKGGSFPHYSMVSLYGGEGYYKVKVIIEIPEKKVTITESQFDELYKETRHGTFENQKMLMKQKLFATVYEG